MNTYPTFKKIIGLLVVMMGCTLALAINQWSNQKKSPPIAKGETQPVLFDRARLMPVGLQPRYVVIEDFNEDGVLDLAVSHAAGVAVLLGDGKGGFGAAQTYPAGVGPSWIAVGDFNEDGHLDLAVANSNNSVSILRGLGTGEFAEPTSVAVPGGAGSGIVAEDFNLDGHLDVAVAGGATVSLLLGQGDGGFQAPRTIYSQRDLRGLIVDDFDNDQIPDLAVARASYCEGYQCGVRRKGGVHVLQGDGQGNFLDRWHHLIEYPLSYTSLVADDVNGDGNLDLITMHNTLGITVLLGTGGGDFISPRYSAFAQGFMAVEDFNMDGLPDLAITQSASNQVAVLLGDGEGNFGPAAMFGTGRTPSSVAVEDLDGDSVPDLVTTDLDSGTVSVLINRSMKQ